MQDMSITGDRYSTVELSRGIVLPDVRQPGEAQAGSDGGLSLEGMLNFLSDMNNEPAWRVLADVCADYYDNNQLNSNVLQLLESRGVPPIIINLIQPTVNAILGMQAKNRRDWMVGFGDDGQSEMSAKAINKKLKAAETDSRADRAVQQAYAAQVKSGLGWVEVGRNSDPFAGRYRSDYIHRREIWWDWRYAEEERWRYLTRKQWYDEDHLIQVMPKHAALIKGTCAGWPMDSFAMVAGMLNGEKTTLADSYERERAFTVSEHEWRDTTRRRCVTFEVWYRIWKTGLVCRLPNNKVIEFGLKNPRHMAAYQAGILQPFSATFPQVRQSMWLGPHRMFDRKSPYPHKHFPYVPFFGYREDLTRIPYGVIRAMISPQDEINARRSRMLALMGSRRMQIDSDALDTNYNSLEDAVEEISRHDGTIVTNPNRRNVAGVHVTDNGDLTAQQFQVLAESKSEIHQVSGVFPSMAGNDTKAVSGIALAGFVEQVTTTLAEINDEYQDANTRVGQLLMSLVVEDSMHPHAVTVGEGKAKKQIFLNRSTGDNEFGDTVKENDIGMAHLELELQETPSSQTYRQQQFAQLAEITKALPPQVQQFVIDFVIESTDHPDRKKMGKRIRSALNIPEDGVDGEQDIDPAVQQVQAQADEAIKMLQEQLQMMAEELDAAKKAAADKAGDQDLKRIELDQKRVESERKDAIEREKMAAEQARAANEQQSAQDADEAARDREFMSGLQADANGNGIPDIEEVVASVVDKLTPLIDAVQGDVKKMTDSLTKSVEKMQSELKVAAAAKPVPIEPPKVIFEAGAFNISPVTNVQAGKPSAKTIKLSEDGKSATVTPNDSNDETGKKGTL